jgi:formate/nitrite transporter FocA (FNT family)
MAKTNSDLQHKEATPKKPYRQILREEVTEGQHELQRPPLGLFLSAISAGLDIGFSVFLMGTVKTMGEDRLSLPTMRILLANTYAVGFIFVVLGRSELFTEHTTLAVLPLLRGKSSLQSVARLWAIVYAGNLLGAAAFAALTAIAGPSTGVIEPRALVAISTTASHLSAGPMILSGILAGWLMGLMSWLVTAARDTISQIVIVWLLAMSIGLAQLDHAIVGSVEVLAGVFVHQGPTMASFGHFLLWTTMGNAIGGTVFVALLKYSHASRGEA